MLAVPRIMGKVILHYACYRSFSTELMLVEEFSYFPPSFLPCLPASPPSLLPPLPASPHEHVPESGEVTVREIVDLRHSPRVQPTSDLLPTHLHNCITAHHRKRDGVLSTDRVSYHRATGQPILGWDSTVKLTNTSKK